MDNSVLQAIGVSNKASAVYIAALPLGTATVQAIASASRMKRTSVYGYINELIDAGVMEKMPRGKRNYYRCVDPQQVRKRIEESAAAFANTMPSLEQLYAQSGVAPKVQFLEGRSGVRQIYGECASAPLIRAFSNLPDIERLFYDEVKDIAKQMVKNGTRLHELMPDLDSTRRTSRRFGSMAGGLYESRILKAGEVFNDMLIYGNTVALLRIHELDLFVVRIEDASIATSFSTLFDAAWNASRPFYPKRS